jgi:hypothetical protein
LLVLVHVFIFIRCFYVISLTECDSGTTQLLPFWSS